MKRILIAVFAVMTVCLEVQAQYIGEKPQQLERRSGHLYTETGTRLDYDMARTILNDENFQSYSSGRELYRAGVIVSSIGGSLGAAGVILFATALSSLKTADSWVPYFLQTVIGTPCMIIGGTMLLTSIPLFCVGNARLKKAAESYNHGNLAFAPELSIGLQQSGIGVGIRF